MSGSPASTTTTVFVGGGSPGFGANANPDFGATAKFGFYGVTPVVQRATAASHTTIATTVVVSTTSAIWGFSTSTQGNAALAAIAEIQATLVAIGIWAA